MSGETDETPEYLSSVQAKTVGGHFPRIGKVAGKVPMITFKDILGSLGVRSI